MWSFDTSCQQYQGQEERTHRQKQSALKLMLVDVAEEVQKVPTRASGSERLPRVRFQRVEGVDKAKKGWVRKVPLLGPVNFISGEPRKPVRQSFCKTLRVHIL